MGAALCPLPTSIERSLWDCDPSGFDFGRHRDFLIERVLGEGTWDDIRWLRSQLGDAAARAQALRSRGRRLSPRQLRFWELVLDLPHEDVERWLLSPERAVWDRRA